MQIRAAVLEEFGEPLVVQEVELGAPRAGEVLVRLHACGVCPRTSGFERGSGRLWRQCGGDARAAGSRTVDGEPASEGVDAVGEPAQAAAFGACAPGAVVADLQV